ncbi:MAG: pilin [Patescibacteria group bacterium]
MNRFLRNSVGIAVIALGFFMAHSASAQLFSQCKAPTSDFTYTCLSTTDCASATAGTSGGVDSLGCVGGHPLDSACCRQEKPKVPSADSPCSSAGGTCKGLCTQGVESQIAGISCSNGNVCCGPLIYNAPQCSAQGGVCEQACQPGEIYMGSYALGCDQGFLCCKTAALVTPPTTAPTTNAPASTNGSTPELAQIDSPDRLVLPPCTKDGSCELDDIVQTGINFATFIMGLSGALFFAVFIYGGAMYLASFGNKTRVETGKKAIKGAVIGMIFVIGAWTIVNTLVQGLRYGKSPGDTAPTTKGQVKPEDKCPLQGDGYTCTTLSGTTGQEAKADGDSKGLSCLTGLCPGAANILCCKAK